MELRQGQPEWVFYEGPPTANGKPGAHHVLARIFKDIYPRFRTMRGNFVARKAGWDCHGLPVELEIEKRLGFTRKEQIEEYGIAEFNRLCKESVTEYVDDWKRMTERIGFWIDLDDAYWTMTDVVHRVGVVDPDRVLEAGPARSRTTRSCPTARAAAPPSRRTSWPWATRLVTDPSIFVRFPLLGADGKPEDGTSLLVWTTTPWTLISNVAAAVGENITYARARLGGETLILAADLVESVLGAEADGRGDVPGRRACWAALPSPLRLRHVGQTRLVRGGRRLRQHRRGHGHRAHRPGLRRRRHGGGPGQRPAGDHARRPARQVHRRGDRPTPGSSSRTPTSAIMRDLDDAGLLFARQPYEHSYPHCWRCDTASDLLREVVLVRADHRPQGRPAELQRRDQLVSRAHQARPLRRLAREQHRLVALARAVLGHAAAHLAVRARARSRGGVAGRTGRAVRSRPDRPGAAPALRRRGHLRLRRVRRRGPPGARGDRRLVRLGLHARGAVALPVRERGGLRAALPGRLHLRGDRPDPGLVLQPHRDQRAAVRPHLATEPASAWATSSTATDARCRSAWATSSTPGACSTTRAPTPCAGISSRSARPGSRAASAPTPSTRSSASSC